MTNLKASKVSSINVKTSKHYSPAFTPLFKVVNQSTFANPKLVNLLEITSIQQLDYAEKTEIEYQKLKYLFENIQSLGDLEKRSFTFNDKEYPITPLYFMDKCSSYELYYEQNSNFELQQTISCLNALLFFNYNMIKKYGANVLFFNLTIKNKMTSKEGSDESVNEFEYNVEFSNSGIATLLFESIYKHFAILSSTQAGSNQPYYFYDIHQKRWSMISKDYLTDLISGHVQELLKILNASKIDINTSKIVKLIFNSFEKIKDDTGNLLDTYSKANPYLIQFDDLVYDMQNDKFAKMERQFMLGHYHDYRIATDYSQSSIDAYDNDLGFTKINLSDEDLKKQCSTILERMKILHYDEDIEFLLSLIGYLFCHKNDWQVFPIIVGGGGLGKSWFYDDFIAKKVIGMHNISSLAQDDLEKGSDFLMSSMYGKELNIVTETNGSYLSPQLLTIFKRLGDTITINPKFKTPFASTLTSTFIMLGNDGQIPAIPPSFSNDTGLGRRLFIINCRDKSYKLDFQKAKGQSIREYFDIDDLIEEIPSFSLLCMRTYQKNLGNIAKLDDIGGATSEIIEGFTSRNIVKGTKDYFRSHNRNREFLIYLADEYASRHNNMSNLNEDTFKTWLTTLSTTEVKSMYKWWFNHHYSHIKVSERNLEEYLKNTHGVYSESGLVDVKGKQLRRKRYGYDFANTVINIIKDEDIEKLDFKDDIEDITTYNNENSYY